MGLILGLLALLEKIVSLTIKPKAIVPLDNIDAREATDLNNQGGPDLELLCDLSYKPAGSQEFIDDPHAEFIIDVERCGVTIDFRKCHERSLSRNMDRVSGGPGSPRHSMEHCRDSVEFGL